jgi:hypothetical protein
MDSALRPCRSRRSHGVHAGVKGRVFMLALRSHCWAMGSRSTMSMAIPANTPPCSDRDSVAAGIPSNPLNARLKTKAAVFAPNPS